ncbi:MAG TPA: hypothetical protein VGL14_16225 [Methylomirabilota bacterium]|jgi:hypothetical protein
MATPTAPVPTAIERWISRARYLRWIDALAAWIVLFAVVVELFPDTARGPLALLAAALLGVGVWLLPLRLHWRPVSGWVGLAASRSLRPGQRAWFVRDGRADAVLITARRGIRISIAAPSLTEAETLSVRRTRVLLIPF